jgi:hypothetical protein
MKKVFLVLALVATYGISIAMTGADVITSENSQTTIVADVIDNDAAAPEAEKEKEKTKEAKTAKTEAKSEGCGTAKSEGCATAKSEGCGEKTKTASTEKK